MVYSDSDLFPHQDMTSTGSSTVGFPCGSAGKASTCSTGDPGWEDPLEKGKATHSSILAWRIPWTV